MGIIIFLRHVECAFVELTAAAAQELIDGTRGPIFKLAASCRQAARGEQQAAAGAVVIIRPIHHQAY